MAASIDDLGRTVWDQLEAPSFYLSCDWLRAVEGMLGPEHPYLVLEERGEAMAVAPCQVVRDVGVYAFYSPRFLLFGPERLSELQRWLSPGRASHLGEIGAAVGHCGESLLPAVVATSPRGYRSGIIYRRSLPESLRDEAAGRLVERLDKLGRSCSAATVAFLYLPDASDPHLERALLARGYVPAVLGGECRLDLPWPDFQAYLAHFHSRRRQSLQSDVRRFQEAGCTVEIGGVELLSDQLAPMQVATQSKYGHAADLARTLRWYARIRAELADYARVSIARRGPDVLGFGLFYEAGRELYARVAGFDYKLLGRERSYFSVVFYEPIRYATAAGLTRIHYGIEAYEAKLQRGCSLQPLRGWFRFHVGGADRLHELLRLHTEGQLARQAWLRGTYLRA